jgi:protein disulfide-isomerase A1
MEGDVIVGTEADLQEIIGAQEFTLVEFYAPWCGHCKNLAPEWAKAATSLKEAGTDNVKLVKVDATIHKSEAEKQGVKGYPTIKFYRSGVATEYNGGRTASEIVSWVEKHTGPAFTTLESAEAASKFIASKDHSLVAHFSDIDSANAEAFKAAASQLDDTPFAIVTDASFVDGLAADSALLIKDYDGGNAAYTGAFEAAAIVEWAKKTSLPSVVEFTQASAPKIFGGDIKVHCLLFLNEGDDATLAEYKKTAAAKKGDALFVYMYAQKEDSKRIIEYFSVDETKLPDARIINLGGAEMQKFKMEAADKTEATFNAFVEDYVSGKLKRFLMSEDPVEYSGKGVRVLTGSDHDLVAKDESLNVFVEYYAPWCGHCKSLAPIWDELAAAYDDVANVVIAKMDSTANEVDGVAVQGFPTLKFYPAGSTEPLDYDGGRELAPLKEYLAKNAVGADAPAAADKDEL